MSLQPGLEQARIGVGVRFERTRRITGYLVGDNQKV